MPVSLLVYLFPFGTALLLYAFFFFFQTDARIDPLTQIGNRLSFPEFIDRLSRRHTGKSWAIVMIDMDHFKEINDTLGHQEGDNALCDMAAIIKGCIKKNDFAARYGGDEFVLTRKVDKKPEDNVLELVNKIQKEVDLFNAKGHRLFKLEISYGYGVFTQDGKQSIDNFMNHIDSLMYQHKQARRRSSDKKEIFRFSSEAIK
jgi:diguanylate cyclase (GGDEF)-like protein